jgi:hypothetical protein
MVSACKKAEETLDDTKVLVEVPVDTKSRVKSPVKQGVQW